MLLNRIVAGAARRAALTAALLAALTSGASAAPRRPASSRLMEVPVVQAGPNDSKIDPALRQISERWAATQALAAGRARIEAERDLFTSSRHLQIEREDGVPFVTTLVKLSDASATRVLEAEGARITTVVGDIAIARIPLSGVAAIAARPEVQCLQISHVTPALLDSSRIRTKVRDVHNGTGGLSQSYKGDGVVVGVLDSGLDYTHADFKTAGGATRLKGLYDFSFGSGGREWSVGSIDSATSTEYDGTGGEGHGTHVTGTAAGGGRRNAGYIGMAPNADLVFVKGMRDTASSSGFADADVVAGCQYIFNKARALGEPCVINLSLGGQFGPHDGSSLYEQALDQLTHPGNIIVAAAGNSGQDYIHAGYAVPPGTTYQESAETPLLIFPSGASAGVDIWYPATGNIRFGVAVYAGGDLSQAVGGTNPIAPGGALAPLVITDGAQNYGTVTIDARTTADPNNGKRNVQISIENAAGATASDYIWTIYAVGTGSFDAWCVFGGAFPPQQFFTFNSIVVPSYFVLGNNDATIGTPATAKKLISVGSYVTKTQWVDVNGVTETQTGAVLDQLSSFSSLGPSADGRTLPNIAAPGEAILAPMAASVTATTAASDILQGGGYKKLQGTSMASPHVTGVVALMLQKNPFLTPENARALLQAGAVAAGTPNTFGAGRLDALAAMIATPDPVACGTPSPFSSVREDCNEAEALPLGALRVHPNPTARAATLAFRLPSAERVDLAIYDLAGRRVRSIQTGTMAAGTHQLVWDGTNDNGVALPSGVYFTRLWTPSRTAVQRLVRVQ